MKNKNDKSKNNRNKFKAVVLWFWRLFSSVRLAVVLILVITCLSLVGALLIQAPVETVKDAQAYSSWINTVATAKVGIWAPFLSALQMFNVFRSPWFTIACALLMLNILICSLNRWSSIRSSIRGGPIIKEKNFYMGDDNCSVLSDINATPAEAAKGSLKILSQRGYRTRDESDRNNAYITADKNRYYRLGTYFSHFSLILFVLAFIAGSYFGFRDLNFSVPVGSIREVGHNTGLSLQLVSFTDEYYEDGTPKDYRSEVILYENSKPVKQATIQVNHPLVYKGVRFFQSYFGPTVKIQVRDENGQDMFIENIPMDSSFVIEGVRRYEGEIETDLLQGISRIRLISSAVNAEDLIIPPGNIAVDVRDASNNQIDFRLVEKDIPRLVGGLEFTFLEDSKYSGFQVSHDPASILIWIASALFVVGISAVLYFPYRQIWVLCEQSGQMNSCLFLRIRSPRGFRSQAELNAIVEGLKKELSNNLTGKERKI